MSAHWKGILGALGAVAMLIYSAFSDGVITGEEWINIIVQVTSAAVVWMTANGPATTWWFYAKVIVASFLLVANLALSYVVDGIDHDEWINLLIAFVTAVLVGFKKNAGSEAPRRHVPA